MFSHAHKLSALLLSGLVLVACDQTTTAPDGGNADRLPDHELAALSNAWITRANLPRVERFGLTTAVVPNAAGQSVLYAIGGQTGTGGSLSNVQAYNVATNSWSDRAPLPRPLFWTNGAGVINGKIYVSGGVASNRNFRAELYQYDPKTDTWTERAPMPTQGFRGISGVIDNRLYVVTNCDQEDCFDGIITAALYRYNPATDRWVVLPPPAHYHGWGFGGVIGGKFYVTGGTSALEVFDPATNHWTEKTPLPRPRWLGAGAALGGRLYVIGGFRGNSDDSETIVATTSVYDPATDTWSNRAPFPEPFINLSASRVVLNGQARIHVVGGTRPGNNRAFVP
jgi:N-acetylneuraminic acid mutarotase